MRVVLIGNYPRENQTIRGGEQAAFRYLVDELCRIEGLEIHLLSPRLSETPAQDVLQQQNGALLHLLPHPRRLEIVRQYPLYCAAVKKKVDMIRPAVIHAQGALANATAAISSGYPVVLTVHGMQREESRHQVSPYLRLRKLVAARLVESPNLRKATHLIAIGRYVVNYFAGLLHPDARVYYIPNGITESFFEVQENEPGKQILFAGRVIRRKRVLDLLQAFRQVHRACPGARLRLAGECASEIPYVRKVLSFVKSSGLEQVVHLLGPLSEREILQEFGHCDLLVLPSGQETAPMVIAQAMAAGKPVIATSVGGITEMVEHGSTGLIIEPGDVPALTASLLRLLDDPPLCRRMGEAGRRRALEEYRASAVAKQTFEVYGEIARTSASL